MCHTALISLFTAICFISVTYAAECSSERGSKFPITCPGLLDPTKKYCCEILDSPSCCDEEEFLTRRSYGDEGKPLKFRIKRGYGYNDLTSQYSTSYTGADGLDTVIIIVISVAVLVIVAIICCCCCCCACCPCYHLCHPNNTNVTILQPSYGYPGTNGQSSVGITMPTGSATSQDLPPQYNQRGYSKLSEPQNPDSNYIQ